MTEEIKTPATEEKVEEKKEGKKKCCGLNFCKKMCNKENCKKNGKWIAIIVLVVIVATSFGVKAYREKSAASQMESVKEKVQKFVDANVQPGTKATIKDITRESDLYKITITVGTQDLVTYASNDGKKLFSGVADLDPKTDTATKQQAAAAPEKTEAEQKTDVPTVDLFVMSYCPYGLQMEKGLLPAVEALGNKIKFNLKFVSYTLHGPKEVTENTNQYCIEKNQPAKLDAYLKCFWKKSTGDSAACMTAVGINAAQIKTCADQTTKQFNLTEKSFGINADDNAKYGVQGSPTLVVNGTTVSSGRDSASVLKAICSGFKNQPKECQAKLPANPPVAGFDDQASGGSASAAPASCATPQQ